MRIGFAISSTISVLIFSIGCAYYRSSQGYFWGVFINGLLLSILSLVLWWNDERGIGDHSLLRTILLDFRITRFSTIGIISLLNSVVMGFLLGASFQSLLIGILMPPNTFIDRNMFFGLSLLSLFLVPLCRFLSESYIILFRVSEKFLFADSPGRKLTSSLSDKGEIDRGEQLDWGAGSDKKNFADW